MQANNDFAHQFFVSLGIYLRNNLQIYLVASPSTYPSYRTVAENLARFIITSTQKVHQEEYLKGELVAESVKKGKMGASRNQFSRKFTKKGRVRQITGNS